MVQHGANMKKSVFFVAYFAFISCGVYAGNMINVGGHTLEVLRGDPQSFVWEDDMGLVWVGTDTGDIDFFRIDERLSNRIWHLTVSHKNTKEKYKSSLVAVDVNCSDGSYKYKTILLYTDFFRKGQCKSDTPEELLNKDHIPVPGTVSEMYPLLGCRKMNRD